MSDENVLALLQSLGEDAKIAFFVYLLIDYGSLWILIGLVAWGVRTVWEYEKNGRRL